MTNPKDAANLHRLDETAVHSETQGSSKSVKSGDADLDTSDSDQDLKCLINAWEVQCDNESHVDTERILDQFGDLIRKRPGLREEFLRAVGLLLDFDAKFGGTSDSGVADHVRTEVQGLLGDSAEPGTTGTIDSFRVGRILGVGGMGIVLRADDTKLARPVAIKILRAHLARNPAANQRFLREARAMAAVHHDHIAPIYQVGQHCGTPYLAMPLLEGETLQSWLDREGPLSIQDVLKIGRETALGLSAAHARGLIHRDIKPGNLWRETTNASPDRQAWRIKLLDFGLARVQVEESGISLTGTIAGTPAYMSPEQAQGRRVDERSDLFSLGVVLYQASSGVLPFIGTNSTATILDIVNKPAASVASLITGFPGRLDDAIQKLLAKEPEDRFQSAVEVSDYLYEIEDELEQARLNSASNDPTPQDRDGTRPRQNPIAELQSPRVPPVRTLLIGLAAVVLLLFAGIISLKWRSHAGWVFVEIESDTPVSLNDVTFTIDDETRVAVSVSDSESWKIEVQPGQRKLRISKEGFEVVSQNITVKSGETLTLRARLEPLSSSAPGKTADRSPERPGRTAIPLSVDWHQNLLSAESVIVGFGDHVSDPVTPLPGIIADPAPVPGVRRWQVESRQPRGDIKSVAWSPCGKLIACGTSPGHVRIFDLETGTLRYLLIASRGQIRGLTWTPDGSWLLSGGDDGVVRMWRSDGSQGPVLIGHTQRIKAIACHPTEDRIATASDDGTIRLWNSRGSHLAICRDHASVSALAWRPDGSELLSGAIDGSASVWSKEGELRLRKTQATRQALLAVSWSPDGARFAVGGWDRSIQVWTADGNEMETFDGQEGWVFGLDWSDDGNLLTCGEDSTIRIWNRDGELTGTQKISSRGFAARWSPDGERAAIGCGSAHLVITNKQGGVETTFAGELPAVRRVAWSRNYQLAIATEDGVIRLLNEAGQAVKVMREHTQALFSLDFSADGKFLASAGWDQKARVWDLEKNVSIVIGGGDPLAWHPTEHRVAHRVGREIRIWSPEEDSVLVETDQYVSALAWTPDGSMLSSANRDGLIQLWNRDGQQIAASQHRPTVTTLSWHPTLPLMASCAASDTVIRLWNAELEPVGQWSGHEISVVDAQWSPRGTVLVSGGTDALLRMWSGDGETLRDLRRDSGAISGVCFSPDGDRIASAGSEGSLTVYSVDRELPVFVVVPLRGTSSLTFDFTGRLIDGSTHDLRKHFLLIGQVDGGLPTDLSQTHAMFTE